MKREFFCCLIGILSLAACTSPPPDQPSPTVEAPTATVAAATSTPSPTTTTQPTPTVTLTPIVTSTPVVAPDYVWLDSDGLMIYSRDGNLCMMDGDAAPVYLMPADACGYDIKYSGLYNDAQSIILLSKEHNPGYGCPSDIAFSYSYATRVWRIDRQTGRTTYLTSTYDIAQQLGAEQPYSITTFQNVPGSNVFVFSTHHFDVPHTKDLYRLDDNGQMTTLLEPGKGTLSFELSPDGQHIAYVSRDDREADPRFDWIGLIDTNGENHRPRIITYHFVFTFSELYVLARPVWRADSDGFWIAIPPPNYPPDVLPNIMTTWYVPVDGEPVQLGSFERPVVLVNAATFSPDGSYVAYEREWEGTLNIMRPDGSGDYVYFDGWISSFDYWEDDTHFIFRRYDGGDDVTTLYRGGIGEEPVLIETFDTYWRALAPAPAEGCTL